MSNSFATPWTVAHQASLSMGSPRQEHWSGLPFPSPGDLPNPGTERLILRLLRWQAGSLPLNHLGSPLFYKVRHNLRWEKNRVPFEWIVLGRLDSVLIQRTNFSPARCGVIVLGGPTGAPADIGVQEGRLRTGLKDCNPAMRTAHPRLPTGFTVRF